MKATLKVFPAYLFCAAFFGLFRSLIPALGKYLNIADSGIYRMLCILFLLGGGVSALIFSLLKKWDPGVLAVSDLWREEDKNPYALTIPGKGTGTCYQPVTFKTDLGVLGMLCLLRCLFSDGTAGVRSIMGYSTDMGFFWRGIWIIVVCPLTEGFLHRGLLQRNLMKYGTVYAVLFSTAAYGVSRCFTASESGMLIYAVFFGLLAARYGFQFSFMVEIIHMFFYICPPMLPFKFLFQNGGMLFSVADLIDTAANFGMAVFAATGIVMLTEKLLKITSTGKLEIRIRCAALRADGTLTVLLLAGLYLLERGAEKAALALLM